MPALFSVDGHHRRRQRLAPALQQIADHGAWHQRLIAERHQHSLGRGRQGADAGLQRSAHLGFGKVGVVRERQARIAREAFRDFGRGSGHPAGLNLGDCFAYALAKDTGEPLLYKGDDFVHTDVRSVFPRGDVDGGSEAT